MQQQERKKLLVVDPELLQSMEAIASSSNDSSFNSYISGRKTNGIFDFFSLTTLPEEPSNGLGTRKRFGEVATALVKFKGKFQREHDIKCHATQTIGTSKPDQLIRSKGEGGEQSIVLVVELKALENINGNFNDDQSGQIMSFLHNLMKVQPWRLLAYGVLSDGRRFEFFKIQRFSSVDKGKGKDMMNEKFHFCRSGIKRDAMGWTLFRQLSLQSDEFLGFTPIKIQGFKIDSTIGSGATSTVYSAYKNDHIAQHDGFACKVYHDGFELREKEFDLLQSFAGIPNLPTVRRTDPSRTSGDLAVLMTSPLGKSWAMDGSVVVSISAFAPLVRALQAIHKDHCHNDVCPQNIIVVHNEASEDAQLFLIDFGSACLKKEIESNPPILSHPLYYDQESNRVFGPQADLAALVRSCYCMTQSTTNSAMLQTASELDREIKRQWHEALTLSAQIPCDYNRLEKLFMTGYLN